MQGMRLAIVVCVLSVLGNLPTIANDQEISGSELTKLLTGNSIDGMWGETHYIQYFSETGRTLYKADGSPGDWGTWRINEDGEYCSTWRGGEENCYDVVDVDGTYYWESQGGERTFPFVIIQGNATGG